MQGDRHMTQSSSIRYIFSIWSAALLLAGNMIGSGLLALPICIGIAGTSAALFGLVVVWLMMLLTGLVIAYHTTQMGRRSAADIPSFFNAFLGSKFKWIAIIANLIMLYGLLVAYLSGTTSILLNTFHLPIQPLLMLVIVFVVMTLLNMFGLPVVRYGTTFFMVVLACSFVYLVGKTGTKIHVANFTHSHWVLLAVGFPVLINAYNCHNLIPTVCHFLNFNLRRIYTTIIIGLTLGFVVNTLWTIVVIGAMPLMGDNGLIYAFAHNFPATISLSHQINNHFYTMTGVIFALLAIITSYITVGAAASNFIRDLRSKYLKVKSRYFDLLLAFLPPLIITLFFPNVFLSVQGIIGSFGIGILFGLLPGYIFLKTSIGVKKIIGLLAVLFFSLVIVLLVLYHWHIIGINLFNHI
jgi:tyrosine-specific transport protein